MKKGLIGIVILAFVALICGSAFAVTLESIDVSVDATLEWTIFNETGLMPEATKDGPSLALPELTIAVGAWEAGTEDAYIKYTAEMGSISLKNSVGYAIYDLEHDITAAQGFTLAADIVPLNLDLVYTANGGYGIGGTYDADIFSVGAKYNSTGAYGVQLVYPMDPITLTGQYAIGSAYLVKGAYALTAGTITLQYKVASDAEIFAELADFPIFDNSMLKLGVTNTENGVDFSGEVVTTLAEGVTLTLNAASTKGALTYFGKIGVSF